MGVEVTGGRLLGDDQWTWFALFSVGILLLGLVINIMTDLGEASPEDRFPEDVTGVLDHAWSEDEALILRSTPDGNDLLGMPTSALVTVQLPGATSIAPSASGWWVTTSTQVHHLDRGSRSAGTHPQHGGDHRWCGVRWAGRAFS